MKYKQFRWFFTSSDKLAFGGKNAEQNELAVSKASKTDLVLHTAKPGSPFIILKGPRITKKDTQEAAIFCASFSQQWKSQKKKAEIHIFKPEQIIKEKAQKIGTFTVLGKVKKINAELKLALTKQKQKLRAVPETAAKKPFLHLLPGNLTKEKTTQKIAEILKQKNIKTSNEEILQALPAGGFKVL